MMHYNKKWLKVLILCVFLLVLVGCLGARGPAQPTKFYVLNSLYSLKVKMPSVGRLRDATIGIGPVTLPQYTDRPQIVTRAIQNEIQIEDFERWGETLQNNFTRVLADNISILLSTDHVVFFPWKRSSFVDYQVEVIVTRFDGNIGENALLRARWVIFGDDGRKKLLSRQSVYLEPTNGNEVADLVSAHSHALARLSHEIAGTIKTLAEK